MRNVNHKYNGDLLDADEFNPNQEENENIVLSTGQILDALNNYQLSISASIYAACGDFYIDSGTANNYALSPTGILKYPIAYRDGMRVRFMPANNNSTSSNITVGTLGTVDLYRATTTGFFPIVAGDLITYIQAEAIYNSSISKFILLNPQSEAGGWSTGDRKSTYKTTADIGWIMMNDGTIGDASSGATTLADPSAQALFTLLWNNCADGQCHVSGGRTVSASADWGLHKNIELPKVIGKASGTKDAGTRVLAYTEGEYTHVNTLGETASHPHKQGQAIEFSFYGDSTGIHTNARCTSNTGDNRNLPFTSTEGGGGAHNNTQPTEYHNTMIKL